MLSKDFPLFHSCLILEGHKLDCKALETAWDNPQKIEVLILLKGFPSKFKKEHQCFVLNFQT